jgi:hypothetical protein
MADIRGNRIYISHAETWGITVDEARALLTQIPDLIEEIEMPENGRLMKAIMRADAAGNKPLVAMLTASLNDLTRELPGRLVVDDLTGETNGD